MKSKLKVIIFIIGVLFSFNFIYANTQTFNVSGISITLSTNFTQDANSTTIFDITQNLSSVPIPTFSDLNSNLSRYTGQLDTQDFQYPVNMKIFDIQTGNLLCSSSLANFDCDIIYNESYISSSRTLYHQYCTDFGLCGITHQTFPFTQNNENEQIRSGIYFKSTIEHEGGGEDSQEETSSGYIPPTPLDNSYIHSRDNFTVRVNTEQTASNCELNFNGTSIPMNINDNICNYTYSFNLENTTNISFSVSYTADGPEVQLDERTVFIYNQQTQRELSGFGFFSIILTFILILGGVLS